MLDVGLLALYYFSFCRLEEPLAAYGIKWEEQETEELLAFVSKAMLEVERRGITPALPSQTVRITRGLRIFIGQREMKIRPMAKTVWLFFLRHPEGIPLKQFIEYEKELAYLYKKVSRSSSPTEISARVKRILDLFNNDLNVNIARVNRALSALLDDACDYRISGSAGEPKRIGLDRKWVIWES